MRKFLFSGAVLGAVFSGIGALNQTRKGPRDWRTVLLWIAWAANTATAVGTVMMDAREKELED